MDDLFRVLDTLKIERCVLAGESSGASVVLEAAQRQPQRFTGLVLVDGRYISVITPLLNSQNLAQKIPNSRLVTIEGAGHVPTMTRPDEVVRAIEDFFPRR